MKVTGWVGAHEFNVDFLILLLTIAEVITLLKDGHDDGGKRFLLEEEIDESRTGDFDMVNKFARDAGFDFFSKFEWLFAKDFRIFEGGIAGIIAMGEVFARGNDDFARGARGTELIKSFGDYGFQLFFVGHCSLLFDEGDGGSPDGFAFPYCVKAFVGHGFEGNVLDAGLKKFRDVLSHLAKVLHEVRFLSGD